MAERQHTAGKSMKDIRFEDTISHQCGITMNDSVEARAIAEVMEKKPNVTVTYLPGVIRIDGDPQLEFKMNEIGEALGRPMTPHLFELLTSTHSGRMVMVDDNTVVCFGKIDKAIFYFDIMDEAVESSLQEISDLLGGSQILGSQIKSELDAHELLHRGLPRAALSKLVDNLHVIQVDEATAAMGMSLRTLQRHKNTPAEHLDVQQSGRTWKFAEILAKATRVFGSQDEAEQWLRRPAIGLNQQRPVDLLTTPAGVQLVEDYLGRLEYDGYT
jgi:putative toxin-antitoxin system antitoxin component (TIGR02293 family)